ncbi:Protein ANTI-SILENCING 1, partial [Cucurbita argyrosperma subsp. sororia]
MVEIEQLENIEFQWGKRKGIGGKKKDVTFYESFTYDGNPDKTKKVKILWFFRSCEIRNYLGAEDTREDELFLASGDGVGLANINPLEAIAGKCNVICISDDSRNPRPSDEELEKADFVFFRTFDVGKQEVCNDMCAKIAGVEVKFLLNRLDTSKDVTRTDTDGKDASVIAIVNTESEDPSGRNTSSGELTLETTENSFKTPTKENVELEEPIEKSSNGERSGVCVIDGRNGMARTSSKQENILDDKVSPKPEIDSNEIHGKGVEARAKDADGRVKSPRASAEDEHRSAKKAKLDSSVQLSHGKTKSDIEGLALNCKNGDTLASPPKVLVSETKDYHETKDSLIKKPKLDEKPSKVSNGKNLKASSQISSVTDCKIDGEIVEVTRRPDADRSRWFKGLPWEERIKDAYEQGTLVLIQNLDPAYTSGEVEDIVWHAFNESCTAKMIQRTAISMPHIGQAHVVFKTKEAAEKVVRKLDEGCLLLANGRALVGSFAIPQLPSKKQIFFGHHSIDKLRHLMQREMKEAVSTSHCSQPNTVEYDMAMEWCLLQERSERACRKLFKQQEEDGVQPVENPFDLAHFESWEYFCLASTREDRLNYLAPGSYQSGFIGNCPLGEVLAFQGSA